MLFELEETAEIDCFSKSFEKEAFETGLVNENETFEYLTFFKPSVWVASRKIFMDKFDKLFFSIPKWLKFAAKEPEVIFLKL